MVYCGKASQGCQSCRTRRIKCDKVRPHCTQCVRVGKTCPGYRDQLSLMFRDESAKVIQKAHALWGVPEASGSGSGSDSSPVSTSPASPTHSRSSVDERPRWKAQVPKEIYATKADQAVRFFIEHYLIGHPDEPKAGGELKGVKWLHSPTIRHSMAAVGLASLGNLRGDKDLHTLARQNYGLALQNMASSIKDMQAADLDVSIRTVVMLALYEVTRGNAEPHTARTHLMGGAAMLRSILPRAGPGVLRALLQLCFSMVTYCTQLSISLLSNLPKSLYADSMPQLIPCLSAGIALPDIFFDWVTLSENLATPQDKPAAELINTIARFVQLSAFVHSYALSDGRPKTADVMLDLLSLDAALDGWERRQVGGIWAVSESTCEPGGFVFPPDGVFENTYHMYTDMWTARVWNHYRWSRNMVNQMLLDYADRYPTSSAPLISAAQQQRSLACVARLSRDALVSIPTHYRHPALKRVHREYFDKTKGGAGMGAAGIPTLLFQIKVPGCAPGVPMHYRLWAMRMLETIWADTGMLQAKAHAEEVRWKVDSERAAASREVWDFNVKVEQDEKVTLPKAAGSTFSR
ncbi:hypothetical protein B0T22DRAFT_367393 [Podospora appendiculata]|uniref:Zn(2)-C6 fungal-type domain-containing protein n=1 Tax=Podospora appendiculata TaxID=314037 RepID=A0AAE0XGR6_9PEZI|nr:hypothetical protein B0T22DRAFT_367393 [Podospora appendiculata]